MNFFGLKRENKSQDSALTINTFGASCVGAGHRKTNKVMQDCSIRETFGESGENIILVVSDGHGGDPYFRSDIGSRMAVEVAKDKLKAFVKEFRYGEDWPLFVARGIREDANGYSQLDITSVDLYCENVFRQLFYQIITSWREKVFSHWNDNLPCEEELLRASSNGDDSVKNIYQNTNPPILEAYGCTILAAVHTPNYWFAFQLGDGTCVAFDDDGNWYCPIPWDSRCNENITTSLCDFGIESFRYCYGKKSPKVLFLASDGIDDSFLGVENGLINKSHGAWYRSLICELIKKKFIWNEKEVIDCLSELSAAKSKDDMSLQMWIDKECGFDYFNRLYRISLAEEEENLKKKNSELYDLEKETEKLRADLGNLHLTSDSTSNDISGLEKTDIWLSRYDSRLSLLLNKVGNSINRLKVKEKKITDVREKKQSEQRKIQRNLEEQKKNQKEIARKIAINTTMLNSYLRDIEMKRNEIASIENEINRLKALLK